MSAPAETLKLSINGEEHAVPAPSSVQTLLQHLQVDARQVAVERNREIVPKTAYASTALASGDQLEIVTFVGGG